VVPADARAFEVTAAGAIFCQNPTKAFVSTDAIPDRPNSNIRSANDGKCQKIPVYGKKNGPLRKNIRLRKLA
jgi:hypothetical protein